MPDKLYQLHIELEEIKPPIWRRFAVKSDITLDRLHDVIQIVMGWTDSHAHGFVIEGKRYVENPESEEDGINEAAVSLCDVVKKKGIEFTYIYDYGDDWEHRLKVEKANVPYDRRHGPLFCLEGRGACPPEDVGGVSGFKEFCKAMSNKAHPSHEEYCDWYGEESFERDRFDVDDVNLSLLMYLRWSRERALSWEWE
jgi:hypothetical protein